MRQLANPFTYSQNLRSIVANKVDKHQTVTHIARTESTDFAFGTLYVVIDIIVLSVLDTRIIRVRSQCKVQVPSVGGSIDRIKLGKPAKPIGTGCHAANARQVGQTDRHGDIGKSLLGLSLVDNQGLANGRNANGRSVGLEKFYQLPDFASLQSIVNDKKLAADTHTHSACQCIDEPLPGI
jgi:hypothetical protein